MQAISHPISPLRDFVISMTHLVNKTQDEPTLVSQGGALLKELITNDSWLPDFCTINHPEYYQQFLLHTDPLERFSVVSFVWGPDHKTPIHDHCVWGLIGMMRGSEISQRYQQDSTGKLVPDGPEAILKAGEVEAVSPILVIFMWCAMLLQPKMLSAFMSMAQILAQSIVILTMQILAKRKVLSLAIHLLKYPIYGIALQILKHEDTAQFSLPSVISQMLSLVAA